MLTLTATDFVCLATTSTRTSPIITTMVPTRSSPCMPGLSVTSTGQSLPRHPATVGDGRGLLGDQHKHLLSFVRGEGVRALRR